VPDLEQGLDGISKIGAATAIKIRLPISIYAAWPNFLRKLLHFLK
jgi:hypothetical protein